LLYSQHFPYRRTLAKVIVDSSRKWIQMVQKAVNRQKRGIKVKINNSVGRPPGVSGPQEVAGGKTPSQPQVSTGGRAGDRVDITSLSSQLQALESKLSDVNVVDSARVDAIKQAISEGRFNVNSEVVADRLIASVKEYQLNQKN